MYKFNIDYKNLKSAFGVNLILTSLFAAGVSLSSVMLLGLSGWFLVGAALAGAGGPLMVQGFNYLLPSAAIRFFAIARTVLRYGERYLGHDSALRAMARLRPALFARLLMTPTQKILTLSRGEASSRFIQDVGELESSLIAQSAPASAFGGLATALVLTLWGNVWACLALLFWLLAALIASLYIQQRIPEGAGPASQAAMGDLKGRFHELMTLLPDIRAYDLGDSLKKELEHLESRLKISKENNISKEVITQAVVTVITGVCLVCVAILCVTSRLQDLALALLATSMGFESLGVLVRTLGQRQTFTEARSRVAQIYDAARDQNTPSSEETPRFILNGTEFNLTSEQRLLIAGSSGSGKTRLIEALIGLRSPSDVPGLTLFNVSRHLFSVCPQDAASLTGTLRDNLLLAFSDTELKDVSKDAIESRIKDALRDACLDRRVAALANGLDTWIGDGGITLSGGERKRLALARAYLRQAPILVLDEPTEGLDLRTEALIIDYLNLRLVRGHQSLILISHRAAPRRLTQTQLQL